MIEHLSEIKLIIEDEHGNIFERLSPWATYVTPPSNLSEGTNFKQRIWNPEIQTVI